MNTKLFISAIGIALCAGMFSLGLTLQFGAFVSQFIPCVQDPANSFPCFGYYDITLMAVSAAVGIAFVLRIAYLLYALRGLSITATIFYSAFLLGVFVFNRPVGYEVSGEYNFVPFKTVSLYLSGEPTWTVAWNNLAGNFAPFILLGLLLPLAVKRPLEGTAIAAISLGTGTVVELAQAVFHMGVFDIDDIILNALGIATGIAITSAATHFIANKTPRSI